MNNVRSFISGEIILFRKSSIFSLFVLSFVVALSLFAGSLTAFAASGSVSGTLDPSDPTLPVVFISTPNCTGQGSTSVHYDVYPFSVDTDGTYTFSINDPSGVASLYIFAVSFDPANPFPTCIAAANTNPISLPVALTAGTQYFAVPFDDTFVQNGTAYILTASGPGEIFGFSDLDCDYPLPTNSVLYSVPAGAPAYFNPDLQSATNFNLPAGTWKISEFSGDFAKVWIACQAQPIWIPTAALGGVTS